MRWVVGLCRCHQVELNQGLRERDGDIIELKRHLGLIQVGPLRPP